MPHITPAIWWITIEDCTGELVNEFGLGHPDAPPIPLGKVQMIAQNNLPCGNSRATILATICTVDGSGLDNMPPPQLEPRFPEYRLP